MTARIVLSVLIATLLTAVSTSAQSTGGQAPLAGRFVDPANGLSLEQAIARAIDQEASLARFERDRFDATLVEHRIVQPHREDHPLAAWQYAGPTM